MIRVIYMEHSCSQYILGFEIVTGNQAKTSKWPPSISAKTGVIVHKVIFWQSYPLFIHGHRVHPNIINYIDIYILCPRVVWQLQTPIRCSEAMQGRCQKAVGDICFTKKWRAETHLQLDLDFDYSKPRLKYCLFKCLSWLTGSFFCFVFVCMYDRGLMKEGVETCPMASICLWTRQLLVCLQICRVCTRLAGEHFIFILMPIVRGSKCVRIPSKNLITCKHIFGSFTDQ